MEQITKVFRAIGFANITIESEEVTEAYARKWGHGLAIRDYIQSSLIYAEKPRTVSRGSVNIKKRKRMRSGSLPDPGPSPASGRQQGAAGETGDMSPPGDI